jgi:hypothetical protein
MECPRCQIQQAEGRADCASCGVVFTKWHTRESPPVPRRAAAAIPGGDASGSWSSRFRPLLTAVPDSVNPLEFGGRVLVYVGFLLWGLYFLQMPIASAYFNHSFMHLVNTPFHEAGHMILMPLGWSFLTSLGGSLGQIAFPLIVAGALLVKNRDPFGAAIGLWWVGESFMDLSPYIADARALQLMLIGGGTGQEIEGHDWEAILTYLGWLKYDLALARLAHVVGWLLMVTALAWGGYTLVLQRRKLRA